MTDRRIYNDVEHKHEFMFTKKNNINQVLLCYIVNQNKNTDDNSNQQKPHRMNCPVVLPGFMTFDRSDDTAYFAIRWPITAFSLKEP